MLFLEVGQFQEHGGVGRDEEQVFNSNSTLVNGRTHSQRTVILSSFLFKTNTGDQKGVAGFFMIKEGGNWNVSPEE